MFKKFLDKYVQFVQRILVTIFLTLIYFIGFGSTALLVRLFCPRLLNHGRKSSSDTSYWLKARQCEGAESCKRQS